MDYSTGMRVTTSTGSRGTVAGVARGRLTVHTDAGGTDSAPAHFRTWKPIVCRETHPVTVTCCDCEPVASRCAPDPATGPTRRAARAAGLAARVATLRALGFTVTADGIIILTPPTEPAHAGA